jgi:predicted acylesterase/phospholipase RssA
MIAMLLQLYSWVFRRLPTRFSIPMLLFLVLFFVLAFPLIAYRIVPDLTGLLGKERVVGIPLSWVFGKELLSAVITTMLAIVGVLLCYLSAVVFYRSARVRLRTPVSYQPQLPSTSPEIQFPALRNLRIGIVLAGGGAKGAYQAGALQAIHEFLESNDALGAVKMIAGTSIGSWNSLFWLANLIKKPKDGISFLQTWWEQVAVPPLIMPDFYIPFMKNSFLTTIPWQEQFDFIFKKNAAIRACLTRHIECDPNGHVNFYLTRSNVGRARLEFTTNRSDLDQAKPNLGVQRPRPPAEPGTYNVATGIDDLKHAVFSSMDLPPLFPYFTIDDSYFEDGGVVDNLPLRFATELEQCELIFVLPLNATFEESVNLTSILRRMLRVIDVRQGVLERNSFKQAYLFNELARLRLELESREQELKNLARETAKVPNMERIAAEVVDRLPSVARMETMAEEQPVDSGVRARLRQHKPVQIFAICPSPKLEVDTAEFWKTDEAGRAFRMMYKETKIKLNDFFINPPMQIGMYRVSPQGATDFFVDF